ncbi:DUF4926 domain-containing protein [Actinokineospora auranticolor]|uniref:DUF4926 domain-containing protein n=1 Tax=Actinokineospora auranticolor TaxID=155976 RepID=UPI001FE33FAE|nr:DUF4926 domain-containing protein [Actinokineospora auranticolor]
MFRQLDVVRIKTSSPEHGLDAGARGVVVQIYEAPGLGYEIEVADEDGRTRYQGAFAPEDLEPW